MDGVGVRGVGLIIATEGSKSGRFWRRLSYGAQRLNFVVVERARQEHSESWIWLTNSKNVYDCTVLG